ncbi:CPBP family intramembrane glutamic endopeptidase [Nocardia sp. NPDC049220]|uniref:CPBP family intramembrane glutamic endopeptidase n=1 Tax=Nocardia sp. NPDC049220 TaxID=3155273 RepID=UPI0033F31C38
MSPTRVAGTAAAIVVPPAWNNWILPRLRLGIRGRTAANAGFAVGYALVLRGKPNWGAPRGVRCGLVSASIVAAGYAALLAVPWVRRRLGEYADRGPEVSAVEWVAVHIPVGTVYSEELVFRATLDPLLDNAFGARAGALLGAVTFGLWHIAPARAAGDSVPATVAATSVGGFVFGWLRRRTDSAVAPALLHLAVDVGGGIAVRVARRLVSSRRD